ncbi:AEC family transporter [Niallia sp. 01092]|uniref:AEC family transporter n=1 Tax=unclassified Niallia TaxID=2837522 RepID=UPI003FD34241
MEFFAVLLPIFFIFGVGYVGEKTLKIDTKPISTMSVYLMSPVLAFSVFYETEFNSDYLMMTIYALVLVFGIIAIVYIVGRIRGYSSKKTCGMILSAAFMNNGNYGTPLVLFAFGVPALHYAVILMVIQQMIMATVGIYVAAKGSSEGGSSKDTLKKVIRVPIMYGAILGVLFHFLHIPISETMLEAIKLVGNAAIPTVMLVLGMQLAKISLKNIQIQRLSFALCLRLIISPLIAWSLTLILPVDDLVKQLMIVLAATPSAANTTLYALQYGTDPDFVSSATLVTTLASLITLPIVLSLV